MKLQEDLYNVSFISIVSDEVKTKANSELLNIARDMGFDVPKYEKVVTGLNGVKEYINY